MLQHLHMKTKLVMVQMASQKLSETQVSCQHILVVAGPDIIDISG